ncbi:hypothetical protein HYPSUDRAFT_198932 [Hypholoma sublateritium FD-334 SS-4]|uniref:NADH:flavin oxidoreductase/NADH oxidase N-terminal domain-containing protein n=1 Tax=Hypholoma sublateritium (strain FD-334 SS-4) TaxID=945553 RepID=A0A0D2P6Z5_HYPSF|nr:hypothetical protein HYPSUDRAFT_198932 [Hypholoma sublateritium FD-334 SS-4]
MAYFISKKTIYLILGLATAISLLLKPSSDTTQSPQALFTPIKVGVQTLQHRVVLAPLTRYRSTQKEHVPITPLMTTYYSQRARHPGSLLVTEATFIAPHAGGYDHVPGIWSAPQIAAWKEITDAVHAEGSFIFLQLWALGRTAKPAVLSEDGFEHVAPSPIAISDKYETPRALTVGEIQQYVLDYAQAARNAVHEAGFDGVEVHCANGYLPDQFLQDVSNTRTDAYGGSVQKRSKFALEVVDAVVKAVGAERTGVRVSPWSTFQSMRMADPKPQFSYFANKLLLAHPDLAYLHAIESEEPSAEESNDFLRDIWAPKPFVTAGNYMRETAIERADASGDLVAFGRFYISNPDLVTRLENDVPLTPYNYSTFYTPETPEGYIDYPFYDARST